MKKCLLGLGVAAVFAVVTSSSGAVFATWNFNGGFPGGTWEGYAADSFDTANFSAATISDVSLLAGQAEAGALGPDASTAMQINNNSGDVNGAVFTFSFTLETGSAINNLDIVITYDYTAASAGGTALNSWTSDADGDTPTAVITQSGLWNTAQVTFADVSVADGGTFTFTTTLSAYGADPGTANFDNFSFNAVPEPVHYALGIFGLAFVSIGAARRFIAMRAA